MGVGARVGVAVGATTTGLCMTTNVRSDGATDAADTDDATAAVAVTAATATTRERRAAMVTGRCDEVATGWPKECGLWEWERTRERVMASGAGVLGEEASSRYPSSSPPAL